MFDKCNYKNKPTAILILFLIVGVLLPFRLLAQDLLSVGSVTADRGVPVQVPVHLVDVPRSILGIDRREPDDAYARLIQAYGLQVKCEPESSVWSMSMSLPNPTYLEYALIYNTSRVAGKRASLIAAYLQNSTRCDFSGAGQDVAVMNLVVHPSAPAGSTLSCSFVEDKTVLSNQMGTMTATSANGGLRFEAGTITVSDKAVKTTVMIEALDSIAGEKKNKAKIRVTRIGDLKKSLKVKLRITGTAKPVQDYKPFSTTIKFKKNKSSKIIKIKPVDDKIKEKTEKIKIAVKKAKKYDRAKPSSVTITVKDNDKKKRK